MTCREKQCGCSRFEPVSNGSSTCQCLHSITRHNRATGSDSNSISEQSLASSMSSLRRHSSEPPASFGPATHHKKKSSVGDLIQKFSRPNSYHQEEEEEDDGFYTADEASEHHLSRSDSSRSNSQRSNASNHAVKSNEAAPSPVLQQQVPVATSTILPAQQRKSLDQQAPNFQAKPAYKKRLLSNSSVEKDSSTPVSMEPHVQPVVKATPDEHSEDEDDSKMLDFARCLPHAFDKVQSQLETGMAEVYRLKQFMMKLCQMQSEFADEMSALIRRERDKVTSWRRPDHMVTCCHSVLDMFERAEEMARIHQWFATEARLSVVEPLETFEGIGTQILNQVIEKEKQITGPMDTRRTAMDKRKAECLRLLNSHGQELGLNVGTPETGGRKTRFFQKLKAGKADQLKDKHATAVFKACESYAEEIEVSNHLLKQYTSSSIPEVLSEMQNLEEMRLNSVRNHLNKFGSLLDPMAKMFMHLSEGLVNSANQITIAADISNFAESTSNQYAEGSKRLAPFKYDLGVPLDQLRAIVSMHKGAGSLFKTTLNDIMERQKIKHPHLRVPQIFPLLQETIESEGGFDTEGIFRISAEASELVELRIQVETGKFPLECSSPHVPAALLKKWLRDLKEPLIVDSLYDDCVALGSKEEGKVTASDIEALIARLPEVNRLVLLGVVELMRHVAAKHTKNLMGIKALAIVFVPSILRCKAENPVVMLKNAQLECRFVELAAELLDTSDYPQEEHTSVRESGLSAEGSLDDLSLSLNHNMNVNEPQRQLGMDPSPISEMTYQSVQRQSLPSAIDSLPSGDQVSRRNQPTRMSEPGPRPSVPPLPELPPGWRSATDPQGRQYYYNIETRARQWERPSIVAKRL